MRGHFIEGKARLAHALGATEARSNARGWVAYGLAVLTAETGDYDAGDRLFELAIELLDDRLGQARARMNLGTTAIDRGDNERGRAIFAEALRTFDELGEQRWALVARRQLAWAHYELGELDRARQLHNEVIPVARRLGMTQLEAQSLGALGEYAALEGRPHEALGPLKESSRIFLEIGDLFFIGANLFRFARVLASLGHAREAAQLLARSDALFVEIGRSTLEPWLVGLNDGTRERIAAQLDDTAYAEASERGRLLPLEEAVKLAISTLESASMPPGSGSGPVLL
jgi:tetratricopeptide (TPR) repeat protein